MSTTVEIGVTDAVERLKDETGKVHFHPVAGERITTFIIPDGKSLTDRIKIVLGGLTHTLDATKNPHWIDTEDSVLKAALEEHFGINNAPRPPGWGDNSNTGQGD